MWVSHNVLERGGERGRQAACQAGTPEVRALSQYLVKPDVPWATDIGNHVRKQGLDAVKGTSCSSTFFLHQFIPCRRLKWLRKTIEKQ